MTTPFTLKRIAAMVALGLAAATPVLAQEVVKIGYSGPLSGGAALYGKNVLDGMQMAVNEINASALESLEAVNSRLRDGGITFHLSEVKGPVIDRLKRSHFLRDLTGQVHLSQHGAIRSIDPELARTTLEARRIDALDDQRAPASREPLPSDSETTREPRRM